MADIISLANKIKRKQHQDAVVAKQKFLAFRHALLRFRNIARCEKCGGETSPLLGRVNTDTVEWRIPYNFCNSCRDDYLDYVAHLKGNGNADHYWQNDLWMDAWRRWIDYQGAVDSYLKSKAYRQFMRELEHVEPEKQ